MKIYKTSNLKYSAVEFHDFWATDYGQLTNVPLKHGKQTMHG